MNQPLRIALVVVLLGAAGVIYYMSSGRVNDVTSRTDYNAALHCLSCDKDFEAKLEVKDRPPIKCPHCGEQSGWYKWQCASCGHVFTPEPSGDPPRQPAMPTCPECGSSTTGRMAGEN